jgi:hypothetical protein
VRDTLSHPPHDVKKYEHPKIRDWILGRGIPQELHDRDALGKVHVVGSSSGGFDNPIVPERRRAPSFIPVREKISFLITGFCKKLNSKNFLTRTNDALRRRISMPWFIKDIS